MNRKRCQAMVACLLGLSLGVALAQEDARPAQREQEPHGGRDFVRERMGIRAAERSGGPFAELEAILANPEQAKEFGLTSQQRSALQNGFKEIGLRRTELQKAMEAAGMEQARLMTTEFLDQDAVMKAVEEAGRLRTEIAKLHARQMILVRNNLSQEQMKRIRQQRQRQRIEHRREQRTGREGEDETRVRSQGPLGDTQEARREEIREKMRERHQRQRPAPDKREAKRNHQYMEETW